MRIPRRDEGSVNLNPAPGNRLSSPAPIEAFGGQFAEDVGKVGKALGKLGDAALDKYQREREKQDNIVINTKLAEAESQIDERWKEHETVIGDFVSDKPKREGSFSGLLRSEADAVYNSAAESITDPRLRKRFEEESALTKVRRSLKADAKENDAWAKFTRNKQADAVVKSSEAAINAMKEGGAEDFLNVVEIVRSGFNNLDALDGTLPDDQNSLTRKGMQNLYERAIGVALDSGSVTDAEKLLADGKEYGAIRGDTTKLEDEIATKRWFGEASLIVKKHSTESGALAELGKQDLSPKERDEKVKVIKQQFAERERLRSQQEREANRAANEYFDKTGQIPPLAVLERMSSEGRRSLVSYAKKVARGDVSFDSDVYVDLQNQLTDAMISGEEFKIDVTQYRDVLGSKYASFYNNVSKWNKKVADGSTSEGEMLGRYTEGLTKEQKAQFQAAYQEDVATSENGEKLVGLKEREEIAKRLRIEVAKPNKFMPWMTHSRMYMLPKEERAAIRGNSDAVKIIVPDRERELILQRYPEGADVSEDVIVDRYLRSDY